MKQDLVQSTGVVAAAVFDHPGSDIDNGDMRIWAARIAERWRASVQAIIDVGRILIEAKELMPFGTFGEMCETKLPFSARTAQRLMAIALDIRLTNPTHVSLLPASWGTLSELTTLSDDEFSSALAQKIIRPDMIRADVEQIRALTRPHESQSESNQRQTASPDTMSAPGVASRPDSGRSESATSEGMDVTAGETAPHSTAMPSGGLAIAHNRLEPGDSLDFFPTPPWATRALIERVFRHLGREGHCKWQTCWEPACGEGHMTFPLKEYFKEVFATDIVDRDNNLVQDFLRDPVEEDQKFDFIITNPPFNDSAEFVLKALKLAGTGVAMFVRLAWLESVGRYENIFRDHPPTLISFFAERVPLHKGRWESEGGTMTAYIWLVWIKGAEPRAPFWIPPGCREALTKADDAKRFGKQPESVEIFETTDEAA